MVSTSIRAVRKDSRHPEFRLRRPEWRESETRRHNADDIIAMSIELDLLSKHVRIAAEGALPDGIAEHHDVLVSVNVLAGLDISSNHRIDAEDRKDIRCDL